MGLHFPKERWRDLERGIRSAALAAGGNRTARAYAEWILSAALTHAQIETLASELTVGETYFFREYRSFEALADTVLPELICQRRGNGRRLRIWSAGCCTGEEAYSLAILLDRFLPEVRDWEISILATDINPRFLQKAAAGVYGEWSFRNPPEWLKGNYFKPLDGSRYEILPRIRRKVNFACLNLAEDVFPTLANNTNAMDLIFCRNVLMYFTPECARNAAANFHRALVDGGTLVTSATETSPQLFHVFEAIHFDGAVLYSKGKRIASQSPAFQFPIEPPAWSVPPAAPAFFELSAPVSPVVVEPGVPAEEMAAVPSAIHERSMELFKQGNYIEAAGVLQSAPISTARDAALMARICANLGRLAEALSWADQAVAMDKLDPGLHYLRAVILQELGALEDSAAALKRAIYIDPGLILAHYALGTLAQRLDRPGETSRHFANTLRLLEHHPADEILPQSDGLAAGRLREMIHSFRGMATA